MRYNVAQLLKEPTGSTRSYELIEEFADAERLFDSAKGTVDMLRTHQGVLVNAEVEIYGTITCGRCLRECGVEFQLAIEEEFFPTVDVNTGRKLELPEDDSYGCIDTNHDLDLNEVVRQYVLTEGPMKPLCSQGCRGLCQVCGENLNERLCDCAQESSNLGRGKLAQLLRKD